ncbi:ribosylglycohydrolase [Flexivirga endophytica]|uniref:Ribosylglycohydrolase n=1 Tax=Flexivirga endophytica TaxID=1849103 RepID=A0A916SVX4_9MICO|nr:ADP-ribosylglycohydrolase family protein [Flexivirga endophytica]GGB18758.1 ribosylglycohydrolase [Flexivirga endophytica]GHB36915.1 ribosylglycohydrolase [Flexivirga endophytica]
MLLGQAIGDALGVPYEFKSPITAGEARMIGGGLGPYSPGEWSDDTQMAICIAQVAATGADLSAYDGLNEIAKRFCEWRFRGASDIGHQTAAVISRADLMIGGAAMDASMSRYDLDNWAPAFQQAATEYAEQHPRSAGNEALMRNGIVGLTRLEDRQATAASARAVAALTHADPLVAASCVLHAEAVRIAVTKARLDIRAGIDLLADDEREQWSAWIDEAERNDPKSFKDNGFTVTALQAAWSAIFHTMPEDPRPDLVNDALQLAISIGHDTDTVAAIAGALLGARYGVSGLRHDWRRQVHGWPHMRGRDLIELALRTVGASGDDEWPARDYEDRSGTAVEVRVPWAPELTIGTQAALATTPATAVVSLSRVGRAEVRDPERHVQAWLVDSDEPATHNNLAFALHDAVDAVQDLLDAGESVFLHCVHAHHRTPSVALLHAVKYGGLSAQDAAAAIRMALGDNKISGLLWATALEEADIHAR